MYLFIKGKADVVSLIPAIFMTLMTVVYILNAKIGFNIPLYMTYIVDMVITVILTAVFFRKKLCRDFSTQFFLMRKFSNNMLK